jgi:hypothetical protein
MEKSSAVHILAQYASIKSDKKIDISYLICPKNSHPLYHVRQCKIIYRCNESSQKYVKKVGKML